MAANDHHHIFLKSNIINSILNAKLVLNINLRPKITIKRNWKNDK